MVNHLSDGFERTQGRVEAAGRAAMRATLRRHGPVPAAAAHIDRLGPEARSAWLKRALRAERAKGLRGDWAYDVNRHIALAQALGRLKADDGTLKQERRRRQTDVAFR